MNNTTNNYGSPELRFSRRARERMREYDVTRRDLRSALGTHLVTASGSLNTQDAAADRNGILTVAAEPGVPIRIGVGFADPKICTSRHARAVLLAATPSGRRIHVVCVPYPNSRLDIVTVWDPDAEHNEGNWASHAQLPTQKGARTLPWCKWRLADPFNPRRPSFRPRNTH